MRQTHEQKVQRAQQRLDSALKAVTTTQITVDLLLEDLKKAREHRRNMKQAVKYAAEMKTPHVNFKYNMLDARRARMGARDAEARYELAVRQRDEAFDVFMLRQYELTNLQRSAQTVNDVRVSNRVAPLSDRPSLFTRIKEFWYEVLG